MFFFDLNFYSRASFYLQQSLAITTTSQFISIFDQHTQTVLKSTIDPTDSITTSLQTLKLQPASKKDRKPVRRQDNQQVNVSDTGVEVVRSENISAKSVSTDIFQQAVSLPGLRNAKLRAIFDNFASPNLSSYFSSESLPSSWTVASVSVSLDKSALIICRIRSTGRPLLMRIPLILRQNSYVQTLEHPTSGSASLDWVLKEFTEIMESSQASTRSAAHLVGDKEELIAPPTILADGLSPGSLFRRGELQQRWWASRFELDRRLQTLLSTLQDSWLGEWHVLTFDEK